MEQLDICSARRIVESLRNDSFTGRFAEADEAARIGLVSQVNAIPPACRNFVRFSYPGSLNRFAKLL